uniref:Uncharacterized protein n=1 Tax=Brassica oleracea TaxID=3712 RepID=A0A3P6F9P1_BRAOL|nr:unnamed protein product [Brassica oleracea]
MSLFASPVPQTGVQGVRHSTFESLRLGLSLWKSRFSSLMKRFRDSWFILVGRANHYMSSLKAGSIVKVDRFEFARLFDNLQVIANTNLELSDVVGQIRSVQGSDLTKETTRVVIRLLIDP